MNPPRVIVLSIDALRADHLPCYGYDRDTAPFLSTLADANTLFTNSYAVSSHTREAMPTMLTGEFPLAAIDSKYKLDALPVSVHYDGPSAMFHSNPFLSRAYGYDSGFDVFDDDLWLGRNRLLTLGRRLFDKIVNRHYAPASTINDRAMQWCNRVGSQFLLWNHYMDVHGPYQPPDQFRTAYADEHVSDRRSQVLLHKAIRTPGRVTDGERQTLVDLYDGEIKYIDSQIRSFVDSLRETGLYSDSLLIITADHGEAFGDDGVYEHPRRLTEGLLRVPLIVAGDNIPSMTVATPVSLRDLAATIADYLGIDPAVPGRSLHHFIDGTVSNREEPVFAQVTKKHTDDVQFYARTGASRARASLSSSTDKVSFDGDEEAIAALRGQVATYSDEAGERATTTHDEEIERRLRNLGYIDE